MSNRYKRIASVDLATDRPTSFTFADLADWVIWQFPRPKHNWMCGAVHPPTAEYGWFPAAIHPHQEQVDVHAHATDPFPTPEAAADWIDKAANH